MLLLNGGAFGGEALASRCCHVLVLICCESLEMVLVCLGVVKPFVYAGGTRVPWRHLAARCLQPPPPPPMQMVSRRWVVSAVRFR
jgi:hypothetical protein